jgi:hypothetical protein
MSLKSLLPASAFRGKIGRWVRKGCLFGLVVTMLIGTAWGQNQNGQGQNNNNQGGAPIAYRVPEPGPLIGAGVVTLMGLGYAWLRRKRATA